MHTPIELASRTIFFRTDLRVMIVRWPAPAPLEVVPADYAQMLAAERCGFSSWLLDVRRRDHVSAERSAWTSSPFYPAAAGQLAPARRRSGVLSSPVLTNTYRSGPNQKSTWTTFWTQPGHSTGNFSSTRAQPCTG